MSDGYILKDEYFSEYSRLIFEKLKQGAGVSVELMDALLKGFAETLFRNAAMPEDFRRLAALAVSEPELSRDSFTVSPTEAKEIIVILYSLDLLRRERDRAMQRDEELRNGSPRLREILGIIGRKGRIRHKELAAELEITPSALTQYLGKYEYDGLFMAYKPGREKIYLLTEKGQALLDRPVSGPEPAAAVSSDSEERATAVSPDYKERATASSASKEHATASSASKEHEAASSASPSAGEAELRKTKQELKEAKKKVSDLNKENKALKKKLTRTRRKEKAYQRMRGMVSVEELQMLAASNAEKEKLIAAEEQNRELQKNVEALIRDVEAMIQRAVPKSENIYHPETRRRELWSVPGSRSRSRGKADNESAEVLAVG